jgi:hypothetical protein
MDELDLIRALRDDAADEHARAIARRALRTRIAGAAEQPAAEGPRWPRPRRQARWLGPAAAVAMVAALAFALLPAGDRDTNGVPFAPATAQAALERAADVAQDAADRPLKPGEFFYVRDRSAGLLTSAAEGGTWSALLRSERETWTGRDGRGRFVARDVGDPVFPGPRDRTNWKAEGSMPLEQSFGPAAGSTSGANGFGAGGSTLSYEELGDLPADGEAMYRRLIELANGAGPSPDVEAFVIIGDLLRSAPVPADVRAGLYRAAAHIKGVRYAGEVTDALGRKGLAVELDHADERRRLVFDPHTSQLLGEQEVLRKRVSYIDAEPGFVTGYRLVLEQGVVASDRARPEAPGLSCRRGTSARRGRGGGRPRPRTARAWRRCS